jgi:hypothetical protein
MHKIDQQLNMMLRGRFDDGWKLSEQMHEEHPDNSRHMFNRGWFLLYRGDLQEGFKALEHGRELKVYGGGHIGTTKPIWNQTDDLNGKTVIIALECGFGDQMIYVRFASEVAKRGGKCIICSTELLHSLFDRVAGVEKCITIDEVSSTKHDYWIPGFSCSWIFGHTFETLPNDIYMSAIPESVEIWKSMLGSMGKKGVPKIGIRWSGSPLFEHQQFRVFPPEFLINLHKEVDAQFYSFQRDTDIMELPDDIVDLQHILLSWEDTAAALKNLDLLITSCTSVAHLASAMGVPTWVIVPILPYHCWTYGEDHSQWYQKTTKVYRQVDFGRWDKTFDKLGCDLKTFVNSINKESE